MRFEYAVKLKRAEEGGFIVTCRDLPEVVTQGDDLEHALAQAADAMDEAFAGRIKRGDAFPVASTPKRAEHVVAPPAEMVAKAALYTVLKSSGVSKQELAHRLGIDEKEVRRLLDPRHGSKLPRLDDAVRALGGRLVIELA
jgi:antitoxin HicB